MSLFRMPSLGADMEAGTLVEWLKQPGDAVHRGDIVAVVETQKGAIEIEIFKDGVLSEHLVAIGATVPVGTPIARIVGGDGAEGEGVEEAAEESLSGSSAIPALDAAPTPTVPTVVAAPVTGAAGVRPKLSPAARRAADRAGVAVDALIGSGPGGAIVLRDVERASAEPAFTEPAQSTAKRAAPPQTGRIDLGEMRKAIAAAMARSKREIPHYYLAHDIDLGAATEWLEAANASRPVSERLLVGVLLLKAVALAARELPEFSGTYEDGTFRPSDGVHVGTATAIRGGGLVAPAIRDTDKSSLQDLMRQLRDVTARARAGRLRSSELAGATITVSSLGDRGVRSLFGVIYPPQVALVGFGRVTVRPWVVEGAVVPRPVISATLAGDHRVSDGHRGGLFLKAIEKLLQTPEAL